MPISTWPIYPFLRYALLILGVLFASRVLLMAWQYERVGELDNALTILLFGLRFDIIVICMLGMLPALLLVMLPRFSVPRVALSWLVRIWLGVLTMLIVFLELSTPAFIDQYDTRPNRLYFEYLDTPGEVLRTAVLEYPWHFAAALVAMGFLARFLLGFDRRVFSSIIPWPIWLRLLALPLLFLVLAIGARSSFDHRPANASTAAFSNDQLLNKLGLSSIYTVLSAWYELRHEASDNSMYGRMQPEEMVDIVRRHSFVPPEQFVEDPLSTWHRQVVDGGERNYNLVIILQESLGAGFVGALGGIGVTPEIDRLATQGLWFENLYATGTRSARGIEAVVAGYLPSPSRSVLKLGLAQQNFATLASILKTHDYDTRFIYGGESHFDNMAGFFLANGFDRVTDQRDYPNPKFRGTWGVSDGDLLDRVDEELRSATSGRPQFILAFTSSNHSPFEFPDDTIELHDADKQTVNNAVKYADYAVGRFFEQARQRDYWDNTFFLVVADHDTRVFGASLVPIDKFRIPGVIIGPGLAPEVYRPVASQVDLAPTLLSLMGLSSDHPLVGHDLTRLPPDFAGRALMQYDNNHAYLFGDQVLVHQPDMPAKQFQYTNGELQERPLDEALAKVAQAHLLWPMYAYREGKYLDTPRDADAR